MYTLYINKVPILHKLLNNNIYYLTTNNDPIENNKLLDHITIQYVNDSNNIITSYDNINEYINKYFKLIEGTITLIN